MSDERDMETTRIDLAAAEDELEELIEERAITLGGTGMHISAGQVDAMRGRFEREEEALKDRIAELKQALS